MSFCRFYLLTCIASIDHVIGNCTGSTMATYVCQQYKVQRYLSCKSLKEARKSILYSIPVQVTISMLSVFVGFAAYAYFEHCDPWTNGWLSQRDQIIPYLSLYLFGSVAPGVAGIYMSAVFGASLSTCSSTINSCAVVIIEDLIKPFKKVSFLISALSNRHQRTLIEVTYTLFRLKRE